MPTWLHLPATSRCDLRLQVMAQRQELRHLFTKFFGRKNAGGEIFPPLSWRNSGFRAHTKLTGASPASHSLPPRSRRRTQTCGQRAAPAGISPVRRGSTGGLYPGTGAQEPQHLRAAGETPLRPGLAADPRPPTEPPGSCQEDPTSSHPSPDEAPKLPPRLHTAPRPAETAAPRSQ